jgi:hypothetical protein
MRVCTLPFRRALYGHNRNDALAGTKVTCMRLCRRFAGPMEIEAGMRRCVAGGKVEDLQRNDTAQNYRKNTVPNVYEGEAAPITRPRKHSCMIRHEGRGADRNAKAWEYPNKLHAINDARLRTARRDSCYGSNQSDRRTATLQRKSALIRPI